MSPERWQKIHELFEAALERPVEERAAFLAHACAGDEETQRRVEAMLAADARDDLLMDRPAYQVANSFASTISRPNDSQSLSGEMIGVYRLIKELGHGGMGRVYLASDTRLGRQAALKLLHSHLINNPERVRRFQREARTASALNHPNIITIYDFGRENGRDYIVSEFVEGRTLRDCLSNQDVSLKQILDLVVQVASALEAAHAAGIVHRDIKPENIMLRPDGYVKVLDFGLAKLTELESGGDENKTDASGVSSHFETQTGMVLGTVNYMSPEQARGQKIDGRSDLFSLGVILYELITGNRPFGGETWHHTMVAITDAEPPPIARHVQGAPPALQEIINQMLAKNREQRYQTARELLADLETLQGQLAADTRIQRIGTGRVQNVTTIDRKMTGVATRVAVITDEGAREKVTGAALPFTRLKRPQLIAAIAIIILCGAATYFYFGRGLGPGRPALTDKDTILLADFVNTTGDAVFDGTLKQGLEVQLEQSPYLNIFPEERARETLQLMERSRDEKITREVGRKICQRRGIKALLVGTIASLGRNYVITLEAVNSQSGEAIAHQQIEAEGKEQVLKALGRASTAMREKLGESLASIRKFDAPIEEATTSSFDAWKTWAQGLGLRRRGNLLEAIPFYKHAIELDPNFAKAYVSLSVVYANLGQPELAAEFAQKAFALRERATEQEKFDIATNYHALVTGDLNQAIEVVEQWKQNYPRDYGPPNRLASLYRLVGQFEKGLEEAREANRLDPEANTPYVNWALALVKLNRFDEAKTVIERALERKLDSPQYHRELYQIAFMSGDTAAMKRQLDWATDKPDEYWTFYWQAQAMSFAGRWRGAQAFYRQASELAEPGNPARAAWFATEPALAGAACSVCPPAGEDRGPAFSRISLQGFVPVPAGKALALALCGQTKQAQSLADEIERRNAQSTLALGIWLPVIRAAIELKRDNSDLAIQLLQTTILYKQAGLFWPTYLRGQAYLRLSNGSKAAMEFQKILDHRGWDVLSPLWPLAHLGLARAAALQGDVVKSRQAYETFFQLWKDADADLPVLIAARREYERLK